jgi:hypothetical protein
VRNKLQERSKQKVRRTAKKTVVEVKEMTTVRMMMMI